MRGIRFAATVRLVILASALYATATATAGAEKKYTFDDSPVTNSQYVQEHAVDVGDSPGHQVRVYEIKYEYPNKDFVLAGVRVVESYVRGMSDYTNWSGPFTTYTVYTMEDGSKVFCRATGTTQTEADGTRRFTFVQSFVGGTGKFKGIRGQLRGSGERVGAAKTLTSHSQGEYWIEE